jgi:tetratricopeptide (TPR) repeat protein
LRKAFKKGLDEDPNEKANAYRTAGEVNEAMGQTDNAIKYYEKAIELNPKVGVKRRLSALKKSAI